MGYAFKCPRRHPQHCRHWTSKPEGCNRNETCQYLHIRSKRFSGDVTNNRTPSLPTVYEDENEDEVITCDERDQGYNDSGSLEEHRKKVHAGSERDHNKCVWDACDQGNEETEEIMAVVEQFDDTEERDILFWKTKTQEEIDKIIESYEMRFCKQRIEGRDSCF